MFRSAPPAIVFTALPLLTVCLALLQRALFLRWGTFDTKALVVPLLQLIIFVMGTRVSVSDLRQVPLARVRWQSDLDCSI